MRLQKSGIFIKIFLSIWLSLFLLTIVSVSIFILMNKDFMHVLQIKAQTERELKHNINFSDKFRNLKSSDFISHAITYANKDNFKVFVFSPDRKELTGQLYPEEVAEAVDTLQKNNIRASRLIHVETITSAIILRDKFGEASSEMPYLVSLYERDQSAIAMRAWFIFYFQEILLHLIIVSLITFFITRHFTSPLRKLNEATDKIADGHYDNLLSDVRVRNDEMGELTAKFISMAERLEENRQQQTRMFRDISHELRSPLTRMRLAIELARPKLDSSTSKLFERIEIEWGRMNHMINDLKIISDAPNIIYEFEKINICRLLRDLMSDFQFEADASGKEISLNIDGNNEIVINGNLNILSSTIENIVRNALKYAQHKVEINLYKNEQGIVVEVIDDGAGIQPENLEKIFTPFFRENSDRARETGGTGLGLAIAKRGVEQHKGKVAAINTSNGFSIIICLPL